MRPMEYCVSQRGRRTDAENIMSEAYNSFEGWEKVIHGACFRTGGSPLAAIYLGCDLKTLLICFPDSPDAFRSCIIDKK